MTDIILDRMTSAVDETLGQLQSKFEEARCCCDQIFVLRQVRPNKKMYVPGDDFHNKGQADGRKIISFCHVISAQHTYA